MQLLFLFSLLGWTLAVQRAIQVRMSEALMQSSALMLIVMYVAGLLGLLQPMGWFVWGFGGVSLLYEGMRLPHRKIKLTRFFPLIILLCAASLYFFTHQERYFFFWDEFSHWGIFIKEMLATHQFYGTGSNAAHLPYFPGTATWQYLVNLPFAYSEAGVYFSHFLLLVIPLAVLFENIKLNQWYWILVIAGAIVTGVYNFGHGFSNTYVDHLVGTWFFGSLVGIYLARHRESFFHTLSASAPLLVLPMIKDVGLFFLALGVGAHILLLLYQKQTQGELNRIGIWLPRRKTWLFPAITLVCAILIVVSWKMNRSAQGIGDEGQTGTAIIRSIFAGESNFSAETERQLSENYWTILTQQQLSKSSLSWNYNEFSLGIMSRFEEEWRLSTTEFYLLFFSLSFLVIFFFKNYRLGTLLLYIGICGLTYLFILFQTYLVGFGSRTDFPSLIRYLHSMVLPMFFAGILCLAPVFSFEKTPRKEARNFLVTMTFLTLFLIFERPYYDPLFSGNRLSSARTQLQPLVEEFRNKADDVNGRVWVYFPVQENGLIRTILRYELTPYPVTVFHDPERLKQDFPKVLESWKETDYLWFPIRPPQEDPAFSQIFKQSAPSKVYRINLDGQNFSLTSL